MTLADATGGGLPWREVPGYVFAQLAGAFVGVGVAHFMFEQHALFFASQHERTGISQWVSEFVATFGLVSVIWGCARRRAGLVPFAVGAYITAAYWFTSSTSFANAAVTLARAASDTFAGIRPVDAPGFIVAQLLGAGAATWLNALADPGKARAISAGTEPGTRVHPEVVEAMREVGIDLASQTPQKLTEISPAVLRCS